MKSHLMIFSVISITFTVFVLSKTAFCDSKDTPANESGIIYRGSNDPTSIYGGSCKSSETEKILLEDIELSKNDIANGVHCVMADFDGN